MRCMPSLHVVRVGRPRKGQGVQMQGQQKGSQILDLSSLTSIKQFANWLGYWPKPICACAKTMGEHVREYDIIERGKKRHIFDPDFVLRAFQKRIRERLLDRVVMPDSVHGFVPRRGCVTNATAHLESSALIRMDIKDFFPSITPDRVFGLMMKVFGLNPRAAWLVTRLCTHKNHLAQGLPNSPIISNMIARKIDIRLGALAESMDLKYTRYADDMYISGELRNPCDMIMERMKTIITEEGFKVNDKKTAVMRRRMKVTGIVIQDGQLKVPLKKRRQLKAMVDHWPQQTPERRLRILGIISWVHDVQPEFAAKMNGRIEKFESGALVKNWTKDIKTKGNVKRELHTR